MVGLVTRENGVQSHHGEIDSVYAELPFLLPTTADFHRVAREKRCLQSLRSRLSSVLGCNHPQTRRRIRFKGRSLNPSCRHAARTLRRSQVDAVGRQATRKIAFHYLACRTNPNSESLSTSIEFHLIALEWCGRCILHPA